ncbi:MAG: cytidine deaminase [Rhizomicrobium sp.]
MSGPSPEMIELAKLMITRAYAPYSRFSVGAVLRGENGKLYAGCNVENAAYPVGCCAEASAISAMIADGERRIAEILVMASGSELVTPCGACRQRLNEFATEDTLVYLWDSAGFFRRVKLADLLPLSFGPSNLGA